MRVLQRLYRTVLVLKDHFLESIIEVLVTSPEAEIIFIALLQVPNEPPIELLVLTRPRARLVPDDARLLQTQVLIWYRMNPPSSFWFSRGPGLVLYQMTPGFFKRRCSSWAVTPQR